MISEQPRDEWDAIGDRLRTVPGLDDVPVPSRLVLLKMLALGRRLGLDDPALVAEVEDRISLRRFCGLGLDEPVAPASALRRFRLRLTASPQGAALLDQATAPEPDVAGGLATPLLSIVSPVYRAEAIVPELVRRVTEEVSRITPSFEIVLVDDGSPDRAWERIQEACAADHRVKGIRLSRNFGQHYAITAGLDSASGRWVVVMDCDLQDDPVYIHDLFAKALAGSDIVYTVKERRAHGPFKNAFGYLFAAAVNWLSAGRRADARVGAFSMLSRRAVEAFRRVGDRHRHYLGVLRWLGFDTAEVVIEHRPRYRGASSYSILALVRHAIDGIVAHSDRLLYLAIGAGFFFLGASILATVYLTVRYFVHGFKEGWTSTIVLILLATGTILFAIGVMGIYIGKIFDQVRQRALYLIQETVNLEPAVTSRAAGAPATQRPGAHVEIGDLRRG